MPPYCTAEDAIDWLGPKNAEDPYRDLTSVDPDADVLVLGGHGLRTGDTFEVTARAGTIAGGLAEDTEYYAIVLSRSRWQVAATLADAQAGIPIDITDEGENMGAILHIPWERYRISESALIDDMFIANALPLPDGADVPPLVNRYTSLLVAGRAAMFTGQTSEDLSVKTETALRQLESFYLKGKPLRNQPPSPTNTAVRTPRTSGAGGDGRGWTRTNSCGQEVI
jgi:hypothetical protein